MSVITDSPDDRVMFFIDLRNMTYTVKRQSPFKKVDFIELVKVLGGNRKIKRAYIFDGSRTTEEGVKTDRFHNWLRYNGFTVDALEYGPEDREQKGVDVKIACKMLVHALNDDYDVAILVSGDGDFVPLVEEVKNAGKKVEVAAFDSSANRQLQRAADEFHDLDVLPLLIMTDMEEETGEEAADPEENGFPEEERWIITIS